MLVSGTHATIAEIDVAEEINESTSGASIGFEDSGKLIISPVAAHSDDRVHSFRRIATTRYDRSRPV
jgi:hypothetical protein